MHSFIFGFGFTYSLIFFMMALITLMNGEYWPALRWVLLCAVSTALTFIITSKTPPQESRTNAFIGLAQGVCIGFGLFLVYVSWVFLKQNETVLWAGSIMIIAAVLLILCHTDKKTSPNLPPDVVRIAMARGDKWAERHCQFHIKGSPDSESTFLNQNALPHPNPAEMGRDLDTTHIHTFQIRNSVVMVVKSLTEVFMAPLTPELVRFLAQKGYTQLHHVYRDLPICGESERNTATAITVDGVRIERWPSWFGTHPDPTRQLQFRLWVTLWKKFILEGRDAWRLEYANEQTSYSFRMNFLGWMKKNNMA